MKEYETIVVIQPNLTEAEQANINERVASQIAKHEGRLFFARNMGKRSLAYPINKQTKGVYYCIDYAAGGTAVQEIERGLRFDENVLRFLTVMRDGDVDVEARATEVVARGENISESEQSGEVAAVDGTKVAEKSEETSNSAEQAVSGETVGEDEKKEE